MRKRHGLFTDVSLCRAAGSCVRLPERRTFRLRPRSRWATRIPRCPGVASFERAAGAPVFERRREAVRPTAAGLVILRHAGVVLD